MIVLGYLQDNLPQKSFAVFAQIFNCGYPQMNCDLLNLDVNLVFHGILFCPSELSGAVSLREICFFKFFLELSRASMYFCAVCTVDCTFNFPFFIR